MLLFNPFKRQPVDTIRREQLEEAERLQVEHQAAAELHAGLAGIYRMRVDRLRRELAGGEVTPLRAAR